MIERTEQRKALEKLLDEIKKIRNLEEQIHDIDVGVAAIWWKLDGQERNDILLWTSNIPYQYHHSTASKGRTEGTGEWLLKHQQFQEWKMSNDSMILWPHGIRKCQVNPRIQKCLIERGRSAGAGKTKLVSNVIDHIRSCRRDCALAYFYCNRNEDSRRDPENILRSFVKQLSLSEDKEAILEALVEAYNKKRQDGFASNKLSVDECKILLLQLAQTYPQTVLVLDALDESQEDHRRYLLEVFNSLISESRDIKILIRADVTMISEISLREKQTSGLRQKTIKVT